MARKWINAIYQIEHLNTARLEFEGEEGILTGLAGFNIGDDLYLHLKDATTQQRVDIPCRIIAVRLSTEVWYDLLLYIDPARNLGVRVNRVRGSSLSDHPLDETTDDDVDVGTLTQAVEEAIEEGSLELESVPTTPRPEPISWFGKQFYIGRPCESVNRIIRLCVNGSDDSIIPLAQLGDEVVVGDGSGGVLSHGVVCEIHAEDTFYYSVAIPVVSSQNDRYVVLPRMEAEAISLVSDGLDYCLRVASQPVH